MPSDFLEKTLETIIYENYQRISERGLLLPHRHIDRQFLLPSGKYVDLINWQVDERELKIIVIELKKDKCIEASLWQLMDYFNEIMCHLVGRFSKVSAHSMLIGDGITANLDKLLLATPKYLSMYSYAYEWDGIRFKHHDETLDIMNALNEKGVEPMYNEDKISKRFIFQETFRTNGGLDAPSSGAEDGV